MTPTCTSRLDLYLFVHLYLPPGLDDLMLKVLVLIYFFPPPFLDGSVCWTVMDALLHSTK